MARAMRMVLWVLLVLCAGVAASRKMGRGRGVVARAAGALCIPTTESLLLEHDKRHECVYELPNGDKAVGVGYNLDDDKDTRRSELSTVLADYDQVNTCMPSSSSSSIIGLSFPSLL
jgi:hypothetical protein